jgi:predicted kinase
MKKKLILVAAPPACGKTYVSELLAKALGHATYLDKDALAPLLRRAFSLCGQATDMDGDFYRENLRSYEYETILDIAFSALRFEEFVILNAPFSTEVRNIDFMRSLKEKAHTLDAELMLIWVSAPIDVCFERIKARNSDRDWLKIANWDEYIKKINYNAPTELEDKNAVDKFSIFDTSTDQTTKHALDEVLRMIKDEK